MHIRVLGAGLAGCEAALYLAGRGYAVELWEQKPHKFSPAHKNADFAELVCSNSLKADRLDSASGLLKAEMKLLGSALLPVAEGCRVAAGGALTCILVIAVSALNLGGIFSRNIWGVFRSSVSQKQAVLVTNMATGASLLISVVLAVMLPNLMLGVINIAYFWATQCFPMALATFFWRGATRTGVFAGLLTGVVAVVVLTETHVTFWGLNQGFVAMILNALVMVAVCLCTNPDEATNETSNALFTCAAQEEPEAVDL